MAVQEVAAKPPRPVQIGRLDSLVRVRRETARLYGAARRGQVPAGDASKLGTLLALLARILEGAELEARIARLEEAADHHAR